MSKSKFNRSHLFKILLEVFSVLFAVLAALGVNKCSTNAKNEQLGKNAYIQIQEELKHNSEILDKDIVSFENAMGVYDSLIQEYTIDTLKVDPFSVNMEFHLITDVAWETTKLTRAINYMEFEHILVISGVYDLVEMYSTALRNNIIYQDSNHKNDNKEIVLLLKEKRRNVENIKDIGKELNRALKSLKWGK